MPCVRQVYDLARMEREECSASAAGGSSPEHSSGGLNAHPSRLRIDGLCCAAVCSAPGVASRGHSIG